MAELDEIEQLRIAALQTLHQKKEAAAHKPMVASQQPTQNYGDRQRPSFDDDPISSFPGYTNSRIQLSPRSAAFVESNMIILKRRKEGLDDRWSRSPSPKYKAIKRKSLSPLPPIRRASPPERKVERKRSSRSPIHIRRGDNNYHSNSTSHRSTHSSNSNRHRQRSRDRDRAPAQTNGHRANSGSTAVSSGNNRTRTEHRHRSRSRSPRRTSRGRRNHEMEIEEDNSERKKRPEKSEQTGKGKVEEETKERSPVVQNNENSNNMEPEEDEKDQEENESSDSESESDPSEAIDLFASEDSESENEGRFKCSSSKPADKVAFPSKPRTKADLAATVLPDGDSKAGGGGRYGDRSRRNPRNDRDRPRNSFKSSFRETDTGSDKHHRRGTGPGSRREDRDKDRHNHRDQTTGRSRNRASSSEKL